MASEPQPEIAIDDELLLRPWTHDDIAAAMEAFATADIQHWHFRRFDTESEAAEWIAGLDRGWTEEKCAYGEVSYWVLAHARGAGVATRACVAATAWAHALGLNRVELQHSTRNEGSRRVALRAGFAEEGVRRGANLHADGWHDMHLYSRLANDPA